MTTPAHPSSVAHRVLAAVIVIPFAGLAGALDLLLVPGLVALVAPTTATMASVGAMALGHVVLRFTDGSLPWLSTPNVVFLGVLAVLGTAAVRLSFTAPEPAPRRPWLPLLPLVVIALLQLYGLVTVGTPESSGVQGGVEMSAVEPAIGRLGLLLVGIGAGLARLRPMALRWTGVVLLVAALSVLLLSLGTERLTGSEPRIAWSRAAATAGPSIAIEGNGTLSGVSPSARYFTLREFRPDAYVSRTRNRWSYSVADFAGFRRPIEGMAVAFLSDEQLVVLAARGAAFEVRGEPAQGGAAVWTRRIPPMEEPALFVDGSGRWSVVGTRPGSGEMVMATAVGSGPVREIRAPPVGEHTFAVPLGERMLLFDRRPGTTPVWTGLSGSLSSFSWEVRLADGAGERGLGILRGLPRCSGPDGAAVLCQASASGVNRGMLWSVDGAGEMRRVGFSPDDLFDGTLRDGVFGAARSGGDAILVDTRKRQGVRLGSPDFAYVQAVHPVAGGAVVHHYDGGSRVTHFRLAGRSAPRR